MEHQLQELIEKIKREGYESADVQARQHIDAAQTEAKNILDDANKKAAQLVEKAKKEIEQLQDSSKAALKQAARDVSITVHKQLQALFGKLLKDAVAAKYDNAVLEEAIVALVKNWANLPEGAEIQVSAEIQKKLQDLVKSKVPELAKKGISINASPDVSLGFRIQEKDGNSYFDFGVETVAEALSAFVNPLLAELLTAKD